MQRDLTARIAEQSGLEVISFRHFDCLVFARGEIIKMFLPMSVRVLMGTSANRRVSGDLLVALESELHELRPPSKRWEISNVLFAAPIENFPELISHSLLKDGAVGAEFLKGIENLLAALPDNRSDWENRIGKRDSFQNVGHNSAVIKFLREAVKLQPERSREGLRFTVVESPPPS